MAELDSTDLTIAQTFCNVQSVLKLFTNWYCDAHLFGLLVVVKVYKRDIILLSDFF